MLEHLVEMRTFEKALKMKFGGLLLHSWDCFDDTLGFTIRTYDTWKQYTKRGAKTWLLGLGDGTVRCLHAWEVPLVQKFVSI
jgi:hypothetical protein